MRDMTAALIVKDKRILLVHNTKHIKLRIEPPGGKLESNEDLKECVKREVREELGIEILPLKLFGIYETDSPEGKFRVYTYISNIINGKIKLLEPEKISKFGWYSIDEMKSFREQGVLVPNLCLAMKDIENYLRNSTS
jgi:8-oxo-dGTP diphosphatase